MPRCSQQPWPGFTMIFTTGQETQNINSFSSELHYEWCFYSIQTSLHIWCPQARAAATGGDQATGELCGDLHRHLPQGELSLVHRVHVTSILSSDWSTGVTWPKYCLLIGFLRSRDFITGLLLALMLVFWLLIGCFQVAMSSVKKDLLTQKGSLVTLYVKPRKSAKKNIYVIGGK